MKLKRYDRKTLVEYMRKRPPHPICRDDEPHRVMDIEKVWAVKWIPDCSGGYEVVKNLTKKDADGMALRHEEIAKNRGWRGKAEVILTA